MGDGWNAGGINLFDHFKLESRQDLMAEVTAAMDSNVSDSKAAARRASYTNTMLGGFTRKIPVCLSEGEYLFSTEFQNTNMGPPTRYGPYSDEASAFSVGGRRFSESSWTICGHTGMLSDYTFLRVGNTSCEPALDWGETVAPSPTPTVGTPINPTLEGVNGGDGDGEGPNGIGTTADTSDTLSDAEIMAIGFGALVVAAAAAAGGTYAQNKGWFSAAAGGGAAGAAAAGAGGGAPNPDSDEFAP